MTPLEAFCAAVEAGDDGRAETLALTMTATDEATLLEMAGSSSIDERWWAIRALAVCGSEQTGPVLQAALVDEDASVRGAAALATAYVYRRHAEAVAPLLSSVASLLADDEGMVRQCAADSLAHCGNAAVPVLERLLRESDHQGARSRAAGALRKIATADAAMVLYRVLNDSNHIVRTYAYESLDELGLLENVLVTLK